MKQTIREMAMAVILAWVVPWFLVSVVLSLQQPKEPIRDEPTLQTAPAAEAVRIPVKTAQGIESMLLEDYLTAVLLAEIPGSFHIQAKMAQAIVARTYALRTVALTDKHPGAVCCESGCCQGYCAPEDYLKAGGTQEVVDKAREAVQATQNLVLTYENELIDATYFACSGGYTESAVAVWGSDVPYLQAVPSPGEENAAHYTDTVVFSRESFRNALGRDLSGSPAAWFGAVTYTRGGGVAWMTVGGKRYTGTQLRSLLGLRSAAFSVSVQGDRIYITTKGHGHRVGMSQYGAQAMAQGGSSWQQILAHYYPGTTLSALPEN